MTSCVYWKGYLAGCMALLLGSTLRAEDLAARLQAVRAELFVAAPGYAEGPSWRDGELFFCSGSLLRADKERQLHKYLDIGPAGTVVTQDGRLLVCDNKHKALLEITREKVHVVADAAGGQPLNSLNDLTLDKDGNIYWTDPAGSSRDSRTGKIFRVTPAGQVMMIGDGLAFPNGIEVDPASRFLYVIESQSQKILRYTLPEAGQPLGEASVFYDLGGSGGDGCAFDEAGNLWVADFHRPETKQGRIVVVSPEARLLGIVAIPAQAVSNLTFGGPNRDEIYCTTGTPDGVFRAVVGIKGFVGHMAKPLTAIRDLGPVPPG